MWTSPLITSPPSELPSRIVRRRIGQHVVRLRIPPGLPDLSQEVFQHWICEALEHRPCVRCGRIDAVLGQQEAIKSEGPTERFEVLEQSLQRIDVEAGRDVAARCRVEAKCLVNGHCGHRLASVLALGWLTPQLRAGLKIRSGGACWRSVCG